MGSEVKSCHLIVSSGFPETDFFSAMVSRKMDLQFIKMGEVLKTLYKSEEGHKIKHYTDKGLPVPSTVTAEILAARFENEERNVLLQGFPKQAEEMDLLLTLLHKHQYRLSGIWYFKIKDIDHYVSDLKESDDLYIQKFGINEGRIRSQAANSEAVFKNLKEAVPIETTFHLIEVDNRKRYTEKEAEALIHSSLAAFS